MSNKTLIRTALAKVRDTLLGGWYFGDEESKSRACHLQFNWTNNVMANLVGGNFFAGIMLLLGADDGFIGLMSMFIFASNCLQIFSPLILEHFPRRKTLLIVMRLVIQTINIAFIGAIPFFPASQQVKLFLFGAAVLILNVMNALITSGYSVWHIQFIPNRIRVNYFSLVTMTNGIVVAVFNLLGGYVLDHFKAADLEAWGFAVIRIFCYALLMYDLFLLSRMKEQPYEQSAQKINLINLFVKPFREKLYLRTVGIAFLWSMIANIPGSYYSVYLLRDVEVSYSFINVVSMLNVPVLVLLTPLWKRFLSRYSWLKTCNISIALYSVHYLLLGLVTKGNYVWLYPATLIYAYVLATGINLFFTNIPYINIPKQNQTIYIGFYSTMCNLGALLGVTFGRQFVTMTESLHLLGAGNKQLLVILVCILMLIASALIFLLRRGVKED